MVLDSESGLAISALPRFFYQPYCERIINQSKAANVHAHELAKQSPPKNRVQITHIRKPVCFAGDEFGSSYFLQLLVERDCMPDGVEEESKLSS